MTTVSSQPSDYVRRLPRLDACAVSDALDKLGLTGAVTGLPQRSGKSRIAGQVITVKLGAVGTAVTGGPPIHLGCTSIERAGPDYDIVVGKPVAGTLTAFTQAAVIEKHALGMGQGRTFAEISEEWMEATQTGNTARAEELAGPRQMIMQANFLRASLFTSVLAYGVSALTMGIGVLTGIVGSALNGSDT